MFYCRLQKVSGSEAAVDVCPREVQPKGALKGNIFIEQVRLIYMRMLQKYYTHLWAIDPAAICGMIRKLEDGLGSG